MPIFTRYVLLACIKCEFSWYVLAYHVEHFPHERSSSATLNPMVKRLSRFQWMNISNYLSRFVIISILCTNQKIYKNHTTEMSQLCALSRKIFRQSFGRSFQVQFYRIVKIFLRRNLQCRFIKLYNCCVDIAFCICRQTAL